jgi:hypothetical protein
MAQEKTPVKIETSHGTIEFIKTTHAQKDTDKVIAEIVREVTPEELTKLNSYADKADGFIAKYVSPGMQNKDLLENLDLAFDRWIHSSDPKKESDKEVIQLIGAAYGRYCISHLGVRWAIIKDDHGTDTALVRENPTTRSFPFTSIQYRIEDKKTDFIYGLYASLKYVIDDAK